MTKDRRAYREDDQTGHEREYVAPQRFRGMGIIIRATEQNMELSNWALNALYSFAFWRFESSTVPKYAATTPDGVFLTVSALQLTYTGGSFPVLCAISLQVLRTKAGPAKRSRPDPVMMLYGAIRRLDVNVLARAPLYVTPHFFNVESNPSQLWTFSLYPV